MVERIIELPVRYKWTVFGAVLALALSAADSARKTPLDALPDLSDPQVIIYTESPPSVFPSAELAPIESQIAVYLYDSVRLYETPPAEQLCEAQRVDPRGKSLM